MTKETRLYNGEMTSSSISNIGNTGQQHVKKVKFEGFFKLYIKINSKWIKYLNVIPDTIKLLEEKLGSILFNINCSSNFCGSLSLNNGMKNKIRYMGHN